ncbi:MAG: ribbon-helix-helix protein, CopG family, partial [Thermoplasmata archaeon]
KRKPTISLRLSTDRLSAIDGLVARTGMRSRTEFIERALDAYVREIREAKVIAVRPWTEKGARAAVVRFLKKRPSAYVSEIAESLGMDFDLAFRVVDSLMEEGTLDRAA